MMKRDHTGKKRATWMTVLAAGLCATWLAPVVVVAVDTTWTAAGNPHLVTSDLVIPAGDTLTLEAGVLVQVENGARLSIVGSMIGVGSLGAPVTLGGTATFPTRIIVSGTLQMEHGVVAILVQPDDGGSLLFTDTMFLPGGDLTMAGAPSHSWLDPPFVACTRCTFDGASLRVDTTMVRLQDTSFSNTFCEVGDGYLLADNLSIDASPFSGLFLREFTQPLHLENITVTNSVDAGMDLIAGNFFVGSGVVLSGNRYPVQIGGAGLLPGSALPTVGNSENHVNVASAGSAVSSMSWADTGIPYVIPSRSRYYGGNLRILPGVTVQLGLAVEFWGDTGVVDVRGLPGLPVTIERLAPGQAWQGLQRFHRIENAIIDGGEIGARFQSSGPPGFIDNTIIRNCDFGTQNNVVVRKTQFVNNLTGSWNDDWTGGLNGASGGNSFEGNGVAVMGNGALVDARSNWWGDASGATSVDNPGGGGETAFAAATVPFLTVRPDFGNSPPVVNMQKNFFFLEPGAKVIFHWEAVDDEAVVAQRIEFDEPVTGTTELAALDGLTRAFEWTVPDVGVIGASPVVRVVAIDAAGQEGWDQLSFLISSDPPPGTLTVTSDLSGPFRAGNAIGPLCWDAQGLSPLGGFVNGTLYLDGDAQAVGLGGVTTYLNCLSGTVRLPFVSTDTARIALSLSDGYNRVQTFFTGNFTIRPDARMGDQPPVIDLLTPVGDEVFSGGTMVPLTWTASDDEAIRGFNVQASYDGGKTWHFIARDLPPAATGFNWTLPASAGIAGVLVRVMVVDRRFQTTTDTPAAPFAIAAGEPGSCGAPPGEVHALRLNANAMTVEWNQTGAGLLYDLVRSDLNTAAGAACLASGLVVTAFDDAQIPAAGESFFYLARAVNDCGAGSWGLDTSGQPRGGACP